MKIIVNGKNFECTKIAGKKYDRFCDAMEEIEARQNKAESGYGKDDVALMRGVIVDIFDNQFTTEDLYEDMDISDLIFKFIEVQGEIQTKLNNKIEKIQKNSQSKMKK